MKIKYIPMVRITSWREEWVCFWYIRCCEREDAMKEITEELIDKTAVQFPTKRMKAKDIEKFQKALEFMDKERQQYR